MKKHWFCVVIVLLVLSGCSGKSHDINTPPVADGLPQPDNLSWWSRAAMNAYMRFSSWRGERSGYITLFARDGVVIHGDAVGFKDIADNLPMTLDTQVRIASMTKPVTAVAAMILVEEGRLGLDDPVANYLPEFADVQVATSHTPDAQGHFPLRPPAAVLTVRHLLMFASGTGAGMVASPLQAHWNENGIHAHDGGTLRERVAHLATLPLFEDPGTQWRYGASADVLAAVIEVITGQMIGTFMTERIFQPLDMEHTRYEPPEDERAGMATVYTQDVDGNLIETETHYDPDWNPGGGGLVSTVSDYMRFALMLWNGGEYRGTRVLQAASVEQMTRLHVLDGVLAGGGPGGTPGIDGLGWGLGMAVVANSEATMTPDRDGDFWWSGYYGTTFFVSPETGLVGVIMTQNEPGEHSGVNYQAYVVQGLALAGL
ncbi:MAG: beta-lactamase family protein [Halioglobus sp.]|nr:beta-lactamase family protein [Halioglobus sp.]